MSKKGERTNPAGLPYYPPKYFLWEKISANFEKEGVIKKKENKSKKFNERYVTLYYNYLLWFKLGKGPNGTPHEKGTTAKGVIELERISEAFKVDHVNEKGWGEGVFMIPTEDEIYYFQADSVGQAQEWINLIRSQVERMKSSPRKESLEEVQKKVGQCQSVFVEGSFRLPLAVPPEDADKYIQDLRRYRSEYKNWTPYINGLSYYAEYNAGRTKGYITWFLNKAKGPNETMNSSEESVLTNWASQIEKAPEEMMQITETMFYMDDIESHLNRFEKLFGIIDAYNIIKHEFHLDPVSYYDEHRVSIQAWLEKLRSYPFAKDVSMREYERGSIVSDDELVKWHYRTNDYTAKVDWEDKEAVEWTCKDHHFTFSNQIYGSILWNGRSWVWTHPRVPFVIRYDYYASKGVFKQHIPVKKEETKPLNTSSRKLAKKDAPSLSDWMYSEGLLQAVTVGQRDPPPEVPPVTQWIVDGNLPPPVLLLAATFHCIRDTIHEILGLGRNVVTGLNPIF